MVLKFITLKGLIGLIEFHEVFKISEILLKRCQMFSSDKSFHLTPFYVIAFKFSANAISSCQIMHHVIQESIFSVVNLATNMGQPPLK